MSNRKYTDIRYEVRFGPKKKSDRISSFFAQEDQAVNFFREKERDNLYVDVYKIQTSTKVKITKLTK